MRDLSKTKLGQFSKALENAQAAFRTEIEKLAEQARAEILPYFRKHGLDFMAGNGTWFIKRLNGDFVEDEALPKNIRDLLMLEVAHADHLGFYIHAIKRGGR